ncbi:MAG: hypothetical protein BGO31_03300 [Bacteroidetes bacterium 43-16]|nr:MAG: hypothetical protein BGO31_03300 [Bacteroidetes bacterium 43-16]
MNSEKILILKELAKDLTVEVSKSVSFNKLSINTELPKDRLDTLLTELENERYIDQYIKENDDNFLIRLKEKGFDVVRDVEE